MLFQAIGPSGPLRKGRGLVDAPGEWLVGRRRNTRIVHGLWTLSALAGASTGLLLAAAYAHQGQVARAQALTGEVVTHAATVPIPYFRAHAMTYAAGVTQNLRDVAGTRALADEAMGIATEWGFSVLRAAATIFRSWYAVQEGRVDEGLARCGPRSTTT
jgi:hypothetical protein